MWESNRTAPPVAMPVLLLLLLAALCSLPAAARPVPHFNAPASISGQHRALMQSFNSTANGAVSAGNSAEPVSPVARLGEDLPDGISMTSTQIDTITVNLTLQDTTAEDFWASYQATIAAVTGRISGVPASQWNFTVTNSSGGVELPGSGISSNNSIDANKTSSAGNGTASSNRARAASNSTSSTTGNSTATQNSTLIANTTSQVNVTQAAGSRASNNTAEAGSSGSSNNSSTNSSQSSGNSAAQQTASSSDNSASSNSSSSNSGCKLLDLQYDIEVAAGAFSTAHRSLQQLTVGDLTVRMSILTANPQLVAYRLTRAASPDAAAAASALRNSCSTEYCARLVAAGVPVNSINIVITPDYSALFSGATSAAKAQKDADRRRFLGGVIGGTVAGALVLLLAGIVVYRDRTRRRTAAAGSAQQLPEPLNDSPGLGKQWQPVADEPKAKLLHFEKPKAVVKPPDSAVTRQLHAVAAALKPVSQQQSAPSPGNYNSVTAASAPAVVAAEDDGMPNDESDYFPVIGYDQSHFLTRKSSDSRRSSFGRRSFGDRPRSSGEYERRSKGVTSHSIWSHNTAGAPPAAATAATSVGALLDAELEIQANSESASGLASPAPFPVLLSTYGTPTTRATPELIPKIEKLAVDPSQLNEALAQYYSSVIQMSQLLDPAGSRMTPGASPLQSPLQRSPGHSRSNSQTSYPDVKMLIGGWPPRSPKAQVAQPMA